MIALALAAYLAAAGPAPCAADPLVADPRLRVTRGLEKGSDHLIVTVSVRNRGRGQTPGTQQHLEIVQNGNVIGTQPIPALGPGEVFPASFQLVVPHKHKRPPLTVTFRYALDAARDRAREDCAAADDVLTATL